MKLFEQRGTHLFLKHYSDKFPRWCNKKGYDMKDIEKMSPKDKNKIILRWKWFTDDDTSAKECESTRASILENMINIKPTNEGEIAWLNNALYVEHETNKVKSYFGLISQTEMEILDKKYRGITNA